MSPARWMALFFAAGSLCFLVGPFPGYADLVGDRADSITFFVGSILFTAAGARRPRMVGAVRQPSRLHLLRHLGRCRLRRSLDGLGARPGRPRTGTPAWERRAS